MYYKTNYLYQIICFMWDDQYYEKNNTMKGLNINQILNY